MTNDISMMRRALEVAAEGLGETWPNPSVGCVIEAGASVRGIGRTAVGGRPHAETEALTKAGALARGATVYVTLEPCAHHGVTPPCVEALIAAGVARVVVAAVDEDPRVAGAGIARLQAAGVEVKTGVLERAAHAILRPFFHRLRTRRPYITVDDGLCGDDRQRYDARLCTCPSATKLEGLRDRGRLSLRVPREMDLHTLLDALSRTGLTSVLLDRGDPLITSLETVETLQPAIHFSTALRIS